MNGAFDEIVDLTHQLREHINEAALKHRKFMAENANREFQELSQSIKDQVTMLTPMCWDYIRNAAGVGETTTGLIKIELKELVEPVAIYFRALSFEVTFPRVIGHSYGHHISISWAHGILL